MHTHANIQMQTQIHKDGLIRSVYSVTFIEHTLHYGALLGTGDVALIKTDNYPLPCGYDILVGEKDIRIF